MNKPALRAKQKRNNMAAIQSNDLMAIVSFVKVARRSGDRMLEVSNVDNGMVFEVHGKDLAEEMYSADRYLSTEQLTKTQLAEKLSTSYNRPFTVTFDKTDGKERVLRGRLLKTEPLLGRSHVEDLDITSGTPLRLVDHRTIQSLIVDGVLYELKK